MTAKYKIVIVLINLVLTVSFFTVFPRRFSGSELGFFVFFASLVAFYLQYKFLIKPYQKEKLKNEASLLFNDPISWVVGFAIGSLLCGIIILSLGLGNYSNTDVNPSSFDIMGIYIGSILGVVAVRSFYQNLHPIYDELELIELLANDLQKAGDRDEIIFSFPAFNLCEFRTVAKLVNGEKEFTSYVDALQSRISTKENSFQGYCYSSTNIKKLYETYATMNQNLPEGVDLGNVKNRCITTANNFVEMMQNENAASKNTKFSEIDPENPLESFIIIGNVVYTLQTWGLPYYRDGEFHDPYVGEYRDKLVSLIARRQVDKQLAKSIKKRINTISNKLWKTTTESKKE